MGIWDIYVTQIRGIPVAKPHARWYSAATPLRASQRATAATAVGAIPGPRMEADHGEAKAKAGRTEWNFNRNQNNHGKKT